MILAVPRVSTLDDIFLEIDLCIFCTFLVAPKFTKCQTLTDIITNPRFYLFNLEMSRNMRRVDRSVCEEGKSKIGAAVVAACCAHSP